jgi:hypothetical protein
VEIPNSSATFNNNLKLASGKQLNIGASGSGATIAVINPATTTDLLSARVTGDTVDRFEVETDGTHNWGPGASGALDTNLFRDSANVLRTNDSLTVDLNLTVAGSGSITGAASIGGNLTVGGIGQDRYIIKPIDTARSSTTTATDDPHLTATVVANGIYLVRFIIFATSADTVNTDLKTAWNVPALATGLKLCHGPTDTAASFTSRTQTQGRFSGHGYVTTLNYQTDSLAIAIIEESIVTIGGTAGSIAFQWAQTASDTDAITVLTGSYMYIRRIG